MTIRRGQLISVPNYSPAQIETLQRNPDIIENWRAADDFEIATSRQRGDRQTAARGGL
jgi:hypothetical protein